MPEDLPTFPPEPPGRMPPPPPPPEDPDDVPEVPPDEPQPLPVTDPPPEPDEPPLVVEIPPRNRRLDSRNGNCVRNRHTCVQELCTIYIVRTSRLNFFCVSADLKPNFVIHAVRWG
jgi:hypothetical protein